MIVKCWMFPFDHVFLWDSFHSHGSFMLLDICLVWSKGGGGTHMFSVGQGREVGHI